MYKETKTKLLRISRASSKRTSEGIAMINVMLIFLLWLSILLAFWGKPVEAKELSIQDKIRLDRLVTCQEGIKKAWIAENNAHLHTLVLNCAIRMHWVYVVESATWKHEIRVNNFLWLKRTVNWIYWFHSFNTGTECREYFVEKWAKYHYKKTPRNFIYGFWIDEQWKFGWSTTDKETYTQILTQIENNKELRIAYNNLYINN